MLVLFFTLRVDIKMSLRVVIPTREVGSIRGERKEKHLAYTRQTDRQTDDPLLLDRQTDLFFLFGNNTYSMKGLNNRQFSGSNL